MTRPALATMTRMRTIRLLDESGRERMPFQCLSFSDRGADPSRGGRRDTYVIIIPPIERAIEKCRVRKGREDFLKRQR